MGRLIGRMPRAQKDTGRPLLAFLALAALAVAMTACTDPPPPTGEGALILSIRTIGPSSPNATLSGGQGETLAGLDGLDATVTRVDVVHRTIASDPSSERVFTIDSDHREFALTGTLSDQATRQLGFFHVPAGYVMQIRAIVVSSRISLRGASLDVRIPSGQHAGVKIDPIDGVPFEIRANERTAARIVFDPFAQLVRNAGQGFIMNPELKAEHVSIAEVSGLLLDRIVVRFNDGVSRARIDDLNAHIGGSVVELDRSSNYFVLHLSAATTLEDALRYYNNLTEVRYALPDTVTFPYSTVPCNTGYDATPFDRVRAATAWDVTQGSRGRQGALIAVVDTGFDLDSPTLARNYAINQHELPQFLFDRDRRGGTSSTEPDGDPGVNDGRIDQADIARFDHDADGVITFDDLQFYQESGIYPCAAPNPRVGFCDRDGNGRITPSDLVDGNRSTIVGFEDGMDDDGAPCTSDPDARCDDLVGWSFETRSNLPISARTGCEGAHGTTVTGTIAGIGVATGSPMCPAPGVAGLNWQARVIPIQYSTLSGVAGTSLERANLSRGIDLIAIRYAAGLGADVINASFGAVYTQGRFEGACGIAASDIPPGKWTELINRLDQEASDIRGELLSRRAILVVGGPNCDRSPGAATDYFWPLQMDLGQRIIRVTRVWNDSDQLYPANPRGASFFDIAAPGGYLTTLDYGGTTQPYCEGNSQSIAFVTGAIGLAIAQCPALRTSFPAEAVRARVLDTARTTLTPTGQVARDRILDVGAMVMSPCP